MRCISVSFAAVLLAVTLAAAPPVAAAPGDCVLRAAIDPAPGDEGSTSITVELEEITFWGSFVPGAQIDLTFTWNGVPFGDFSPGIADAAGDFLFVHAFWGNQEGAWTVTASVPGADCAGAVDVTVSALPDTAVAPETPAAQGLMYAVACLLAFVALTAYAASRRARLRLHANQETKC